MRILIAEDDPVSRRVLQSTLLKWGYEVDVACNGKEAWKVLQGDNSPRMAILDWMMPQMDGLEICRALRRRDDAPYVYAMLLTAKSQREDLLTGLTAGADDYLMKPFDKHELKARLHAGKRILDLQVQLMASKEIVRVQAIRDPLTNLPNRLLFSDRLADRLNNAARNNHMMGVMFLDLDHFKVINDSLGHNVGDELLQVVADKLSECVRDADTLARMGGDEFTVVLSQINGPAEAIMVAQRMLSALSEPLVVANRHLSISASVGISVYPTDGIDCETLVRTADAAMYKAKEQGRNRYRLFTADLNMEIEERENMESALRVAMERDEFLMHYQIRIDPNTGVAPGAEAFIRWNHPKLGLLPAAQFIGLADDLGLSEPITNWVLHQACEQNKTWQALGLSNMDVTVNISPRSLNRADLVETVKATLAETGLDPQHLGLEFTESAIMKNPAIAETVLNELKELGVRICIDDFGTGYSSLSQLMHLPIDSVKIDPSFTKQIITNPNNASVVKAIIMMAHSMNMKVTAVGVETLEQVEFLQSLRCDAIQGYFISRPVPGKEIPYLLAEGSPPRANWISLAA